MLLSQYQPPRWLSGKESACNAGESGDTGLIPGSGNPLEKKMATHSSILGRLHGQRSLAGYSLKGHKELHMTGRLNYVALVRTTLLKYNSPTEKNQF